MRALKVIMRDSQRPQNPGNCPFRLGARGVPPHEPQPPLGHYGAQTGCRYGGEFGAGLSTKIHAPFQIGQELHRCTSAVRCRLLATMPIRSPMPTLLYAIGCLLVQSPAPCCRATYKAVFLSILCSIGKKVATVAT